MSIVSDVRSALGYVIVEQRFEGASGEAVILWRVRRLSPKDALSFGGGASILMAAIPALTEEDPEIAAAEAAARAAAVQGAALDLSERAEAVAMAAVQAVSRDGEIWAPVQLVADRAEESTDEGEGAGPARLYIGTLSADVLAAVVVAALSGPKEAKQRVSSFRPGECSTVARPRRKALRRKAQ